MHQLPSNLVSPLELLPVSVSTDFDDYVIVPQESTSPSSTTAQLESHQDSSPSQLPLLEGVPLELQLELGTYRPSLTVAPSRRPQDTVASLNNSWSSGPVGLHSLLPFKKPQELYMSSHYT